MAMIVKVRFKRASKFYDFDPAGLELHTGMRVVTETIRGVELGECMSGVLEVADDRIVAPLRPIIRVATPTDLETQTRNEAYEKQAFGIAEERIAEHHLEMKLVDVEYAFDHSKITFYFTANGRVDFRLLVKNLASIFKTRIELRQIGVRDEAKLLGGIGPCGRPICCQSFLSELSPVTIKMAKEQNLSLNPTKISGLCDKLMCCLKYEQDHYEETRKRMPRMGKEILTPDGIGTVSVVNALSETVRVRIAVGDNFEIRQYSIEECEKLKGQRPAPVNAENAENADAAADAADENTDTEQAAAALNESENQPAEEKSAAPAAKPDGRRFEPRPRQEPQDRQPPREGGERRQGFRQGAPRPQQGAPRAAQPNGDRRPPRGSRSEGNTQGPRGPRPSRKPFQPVNAAPAAPQASPAVQTPEENPEA